MKSGFFNVNSLPYCCCFLLLTFILLAPVSISASSNGTIQWELVNPFRFISDQNQIDEIKRVYDQLNPAERTAYNLEQMLQKLSEEEVDKKRLAERQKMGCALKRSESERNKCLDETKIPYEGWFARLAKNNYERTCWNPETRLYGKPGNCDDYIFPKSHLVRVWIVNASNGQSPQWFLNGQTLAGTKVCPERFAKETCIEFDLPYDSFAPQTYKIEAKFSDGSIINSPLQVTDKLVAGLGDSYAAGEGNPDIPARFTKGKTDVDVIYTLRIRRVPQRDWDGDGQWLDWRCHRSMYSYQFKTALMMALANRRQAVTYVSYACSGATTDNIIDKPQKPNEDNGSVTPQIDALSKVLKRADGKMREIDYLLLSTGGNDVGFAKYVAYIVTTGAVKRLATYGVSEQYLKDNAEKQIRKTLLTGPDSAPGNYTRLQRTLLSGEKIKIKECPVNYPCNRILLTTYPDIMRDETGNICRADRKEFDLTFRPDADRAKRIDIVRKYVFSTLQDIQTDSAIKNNLGWTIITDHSNKYANHGFCAQNRNSLSKTGEEFVMPTRNDRTWTPFDPRDYKAYERRQRWIRLPIDSKLTTDQVHIFWKFHFDLFFEDDRSNIMHPTAEGLAVNADANIAALKNWER